MTKKIVGIWAQAQAGVIGKDQTMPWHLPAELQHFKETTMNQVILMGRVTFDGMNRRILPHRTSIILTRDTSYKIEDSRVLIFHDVASVLDWYQQQEKSLYIIGGAKILSVFEKYLEELIVTEIDATLEGDTYFPENFDWTEFEEVFQKSHPKDDKNIYDFRVRYLKRKS